MKLYNYANLLEMVNIKDLELQECERIKPIREIMVERPSYVSKIIGFEIKNDFKMIVEVYFEQTSEGKISLHYDFKILKSETWSKECDYCYFFEVEKEYKDIEEKLLFFIKKILLILEMEENTLPFYNHALKKTEQIKRMTSEELERSYQNLENNIKKEEAEIKRMIKTVKELNVYRIQAVEGYTDMLIKESRIKFIKEQIEEALEKRDKEKFMKYTAELKKLTE